MAMLWLSGTAFAQRPVRVYATQKVEYQVKIDATLNKKDTLFVSRKKAIEKFVAQNSEWNQEKEIVIPVVFHIIYGSEKVYPGEKEAYYQLEALNRDFSGVINELSNNKKNETYVKENFDKRHSKDVKLKFCLAESIKVKGKTQNGINFIQSKNAVWYANNLMKAAKTGGADPWDSELYLNVWVVQMAKDTCGFAQMPGGDPATDGIVIDYNFFGQLGGPFLEKYYNQGKTLTHLVGSYLGLYELWNENNPCTDDFVDDTPVHNGPNSGRHTYKHYSTCNDNPVEMTMNFMDNSDDSELFMFTEGQKRRMYSILSKKGARGKLGEGASKCKEADEKLQGPQLSQIDLRNNITNAPPNYKLNVFPNPADQSVNIQVDIPSEHNYNLVIYSNIGQVVHQQKAEAGGAHQFLLNTSLWPSGIYYVHMTSGYKQLTEKLIITQK